MRINIHDNVYVNQHEPSSDFPNVPKVHINRQELSSICGIPRFAEITRYGIAWHICGVPFGQSSV